MPDKVMGETSEPTHVHVCPVCGDGWSHADADCQEPETPLPIAWVRRAWAKCPMHEGRDD
jgi:hypothetical protein